MIFVTFMLVMFVILSTTFNTMLLFAWVHLTLRPSFQGRILPGPLPGPLLGPLWSPRGHHLGPWSRPGQTLLCALLRNLLQQQAIWWQFVNLWEKAVTLTLTTFDPGVRNAQRDRNIHRRQITTELSWSCCLTSFHRRHPTSVLRFRGLALVTLVTPWEV